MRFQGKLLGLHQSQVHLPLLRFQHRQYQEEKS
jgi:hypothetical protein